METKIEKNHYRKVFKSDHLGSSDLEDMIEEKKSLIFTIKEVKQYKGELVNGKMKGRVSVAGKEIDANIAYFIEPIKPLVLNATNSKVVKMFAGGSPFVEDWKNIPVELYIDENVKMKGETVGGIRIRLTKPPLPTLTPENAAYPKVVDYIRKGGAMSDIEKKFVLTKDIKLKIESDANIV